MGEPKNVQLNSGVSVTIVKVMCGSPTGMGQLIKYFESQSRRLDRQTAQPISLSLNPDFESAIKFNGVPILPPAITSGRREELRQLKKDAVLLEKRLKARQRREIMNKADSLISQSQLFFSDTSSKQTVRHLNFIPDGHEESSRFIHLNDRIGVLDLCDTPSATDTGNDDFGLHTMDSVTSDFMSLDSESIPRVFSGLVLTSVKEQKISYDLDRLSKALNVQDLASTSGSDISDILDFPHIRDRIDLLVVKKEEELKSVQGIENKCLSVVADEHNVDCTMSFNDYKNTTVRASDTSGFVDNTNTTSVEQMQSSLNSSPKTTTTEGNLSNRSSPKSLKSGVHFASFVTEYMNPSASQSYEYQTVVKKKMSSDDSVTKHDYDINVVLPVIGDPGESRKKNMLPNRVSDCENGNGLLDKVSFCVESETSPVTALFSKVSQSYIRSETYNSDKENDVPHLYRNLTQGHKRSVEIGTEVKHDSDEQGSIVSPANGSKQHKTTEDEQKSNTSPDNIHRNSIEEKTTKCSPHSENLHKDSVSVDRRIEVSQNVSSLIPSGYAGSNYTSSVAESDPLVFASVTLRAASLENTPLLNSQDSIRSNTLTNAPELNGTVRSQCPKDRSTVPMNVSDTGIHTSDMKTNQRQERLEERYKLTDKEDNTLDSPKKLNIDASITELSSQDKCNTPSQTNICRNSYTLSEPSPALIQAQGKPKTEKKEKNNEQRTATIPDNNICNDKQQNVGVRLFSPKRVQHTSTKDTVHSKSQLKMAIPSETETEGKTEHINKYLNQVQFQNSMNFSGQSWDTHGLSVEDRVENMEESNEFRHPLTQRNDEGDCHMSMLDLLSRSVAESQGSLEHLTIEELLELHHQKMTDRRQALISQQQRDMEELFVQQRREVMLLEAEIKAAQRLEREQQKFLIQNAPENIKVKSRNRDSEYSPVQTGNFENADVKNWQQKPDTDVISDNTQPQSSQQLLSGSPPAASLKLQPKTYQWTDVVSGKRKKGHSKSHLQPSKSIMCKSPDISNPDNQTRPKSTTGDNFYTMTVLSTGAVGKDNSSPEFSTSVTSPHLRRPVVLRSPLKYTSLNHHYRIVVPPEAYLPEMQVKFNKLTAAAKGFLTRCLMRSDKVQELVKTIRDTREFAFSFQTETPIKKGMFTSQDKVLLERIVAQLQAAVLDIHEIFFEISVAERMTLIQQTRLSEQEKRVKAALRDNMRDSGPKISQATLKALERRRKSREAEESIVISTSRSRTAPPRTSSPHRSSHIESRALKPLQGGSQISPIRPDTIRIEKGHPDTGKEKLLTQPKRITSVSNKSVSVLVKASSDSQKKGSVKLSAVTKPLIKFKNETNKPSNRPSKSWR